SAATPAGSTASTRPPPGAPSPEPRQEPEEDMNLKTWTRHLVLALATTAFAQAAAAPAPASLIVPFPPGGPADSAARMLQPGLAENLGSLVVVENYGGAGGSIGVGRMLSQPADGQTVLLATVAEPILAPLV